MIGSARRAGITVLALSLLGTLAPAGAEDASAHTRRSGLAAVVSQQAGVVSLVDVGQGRVVRTLPVPRVPASLAASPDGRGLYVSHPDLGLVSHVDLGTGRVKSFGVGREPFGLAVAQGGAAVLVTDWDGQVLIRVDTASGRETGRVDVGRAPAHVVVDEARGLAYVAARESNAVSIVDIAAMTRTASVPVGTAPFALALSPDGRRLYVANVRSNDLSVVDTVTHRETARVKVGLMPYGVAVTPDGARILVTSQQSGTLIVVDAASLEVADRIRIGSFPEGLAVRMASSVLAVDWAGDEVSEVDLETGTVKARIKVGAGPRTVILLPDVRGRDTSPLPTVARPGG
ncbi:YncE family protein [Ancylobacter pratisalsi]|uniref:YncE family protein n=1 Tax=Ancylobacter pratisalsi TaxID=1745854 RepID=A0A6P1YQP2_9HYPH|nr:YncE family protein [Ancylobacter pratisalsi]QIB35768.1 YncE family protein [Ancylobacter pratisalsi]